MMKVDDLSVALNSERTAYQLAKTVFVVMGVWRKTI